MPCIISSYFGNDTPSEKHIIKVFNVDYLALKSGAGVQ
jgi:hypothetical protein